MDRTETSASAAGGGSRVAGSQSRLSPWLLLILAAAALFRLATEVTDRESDTLIRWTPAAKAAASAGSGRRPILYDFTAEWCAPCKILDHEGWNDPEVAGIVHALFIPARVMDRQREDGRNTPEVSALQEKYGVRAFPTLVVAAADGREIAKFEGYRGRAELLRFLRESSAKARGTRSF
jgi:thiol:disulfide interchange protein